MIMHVQIIYMFFFCSLFLTLNLSLSLYLSLSPSRMCLVCINCHLVLSEWSQQAVCVSRVVARYEPKVSLRTLHFAKREQNDY